MIKKIRMLSDVTKKKGFILSRLPQGQVRLLVLAQPLSNRVWRPARVRNHHFLLTITHRLWVS